MSKSKVPHNDVALRILEATDVLMAKNGVHNLSTHKIAKEAKVSVGTIYLYFKDKDDLLDKLILHLFDLFTKEQQKHYDPSLPLFEQYRALWMGKLRFMRQNPYVIQNIHQYKLLPTFKDLIKACENDESLVWIKFIKEGQKQGVIASLPTHLLYVMSLDVAEQILLLEKIIDESYSDEALEEVIIRTWKAITV
ncbi:AcrR family transcriptional regulator [Pasteurellaceae bacterium 15-036681]|nr:AcrR family transcriptional regulator [Pasteurellaceae bacterium 15-036681]